MRVSDAGPATQVIEEAGLVAVLRGHDGRRIPEVCSALIDHGIRAVEITLTTPGALIAIEEVASALPTGVVVGCGSVLTAKDAERSLAAGAQFLVSPVAVRDVITVGQAAGVPTYPGAFSPNEIHDASVLGVEAVKLFPASALEPRYLSDVLAPLGGLKVMPTGGITIEQISAWLKAGAFAVGLGGPLIGDALAGGDLAALTARVARAIEATRAAREEAA